MNMVFVLHERNSTAELCHVIGINLRNVLIINTFNIFSTIRGVQKFYWKVRTWNCGDVLMPI